MIKENEQMNEWMNEWMGCIRPLWWAPAELSGIPPSASDTPCYPKSSTQKQQFESN